MDLNEYLALLLKRKQTILFILLVCFAAAIVLIAVQPLKYGSTSRLLVSQSFSPSTDAYNISRTNDYLGNLFGNVVTSDFFYKDVLSSGYNIDEQYFKKEGSYGDMMEKWSKTVKVGTLGNGSGIIEVEVYHPDKEQVAQISEAVNYVLKNKNESYHGLGGGVFVRIIDKPVVSDYPVKPDLLVIFPLTFLVGLGIAFLYIYLLPQEKYALHLVPSFGKKKKEEEELSQSSLRGNSDDGMEDLGSIIEQKRKEFFEQGKLKEVNTSEKNFNQSEDYTREDVENESEKEVEDKEEQALSERDKEDDATDKKSNLNPEDIEAYGDMRNII